MPLDAFNSAVIQSKSRRLAKTLQGSFQARKETKNAAVASPSLVAIRGHLYPATNIDGEVSVVENVGRPAAAIYQGSAGGSSVINIGGGASTPPGGGSSGETDHGLLFGLGDDDHPQYLTFARAQEDFYTQSEIDAFLETIDEHPAVTSPDGTIGGDFGAQALDVNEAHNFDWTGAHSFTQEIDGYRLALAHGTYGPRIQFANSGGDTYRLIASSAGDFRVQYNGSNQWVMTDTSLLDLYSNLVHIHDDLQVSGDAEIIGVLDVDEITSSTDLEIFPTGDVLMDGVQRWVDWAVEQSGVRIDWTCDTPSQFCTMEVDTLTVKDFRVENAAVRTGELIVGPSGAELSRALVSPGDNNSAVAYFENISGDHKIFFDGEDVIYRYYCEHPVSSLAGTIGDIDHQYVFSEPPPAAVTLLNKNFEGVTVPSVPTDLKQTGKNNSTTITTGYWETYLTGSNQVLSAVAPIGDDVNYHIHHMTTAARSWANYEITGRVLGNSVGAGRGITLLSKYGDASPSDTYIRIRRYGNNTYHVAPHGYANPDNGTTDSGFSDSVQIWTHYKIRVFDDGVNTTNVKAKFWSEYGTEPGTWQIDCNWLGADRPKTGTVGFWGYQSYGSNVWYDDLKVVELDSGAAAVTEVTPTVTITDDSAQVFAIVTVGPEEHAGGSGGTPGPPGSITDWSLVRFGGQDDSGAYSLLYKYTGTLTPGDLSVTFETNEDWIAATVFVAEKVYAGGYNTDGFAYRDGGTWLDTSTTYDDGYLEIVIAVVEDGDSAVSTADAINVANNSNSTRYRHHLSKLVMQGKPDNVEYAISPPTSGFVTRISISPLPSGDTAWSTGLASGVVTYATPGDLEDNEQAWTIQFGDNAPPLGCTVYPGTAVIGMGVAGDGAWMASALDELAGGPYDQFFIRGDDPLDWEVMLRSGYLGGLPAQGTLGFWFSLDGAVVELSDQRALFQNVNMEWTNSSGDPLAQVTQNLGFTSFEHPNDTADIDDFTKQNGYNLLATDSTVLGGLYGDHHPATNERVIRLTTHDYFQQALTDSDTHMRTEIVANAYTANTQATAKLWALTGPEGDLGTPRAEAGVIANVSTSDVASVDIHGDTTIYGGELIVDNDNMRVRKSTGSPRVYIDGPAGFTRQFAFQTSGSQRWGFLAHSSAESGNDAGSDFRIYRFDDNGNYKGPSMCITRATGYVGIKETVPTAPLDVLGDTIRLQKSRTPASASASGNQGDICWDSSYIYICTATDTWKRVAISTW